MHAASLLADPHFRDEWQDLHRQCPWATVFQDVPYLTRWYQLYSTQYEPVVVVGRDGHGALAGLLCLGLERQSAELIIAGTPHSEYSGWLAGPEYNDQYIESAMDRLAEQFPAGKLGFGFLPPGTPLGWLAPGRRWRRPCDLQSLSRPIMAVGDGSKIRETLQKKSNKQHITKLKKLGHLEFERVSRFEEIANDFDEMIAFHDFRWGAMYGIMPFREDPSKKAFFRSLYEVPDLLYTTVWRLDGKVFSARVDFMYREWVSFGFGAHSPFLAKRSPGSMHLYVLGLLLASEGIPQLDLTAGGDSYKERFATHHDEVHRLVVFFSAAERLRARAKAAARRTAKRILGYASITPNQVRKTIDNIKTITKKMSTSPRSLLPAGSREHDRVIYHLDRASIVGDLSDQPIVRRDVLADLLVYERDNAQAPSRQEFLRNAMERIERGDHFYTCVEDGSLIAHIWLTRLSGSAGEDQEELALGFPAGSVLLDGFATHLSHRYKGLFRASVARILADLVLSADPNQVVVIVDSDDRSARQVLAELGFDDQAARAVGQKETTFKGPNSAVEHHRPLKSYD